MSTATTELCMSMVGEGAPVCIIWNGAQRPLCSSINCNRRERLPLSCLGGMFLSMPALEDTRRKYDGSIGGAPGDGDPPITLTTQADKRCTCD